MNKISWKIAVAMVLAYGLGLVAGTLIGLGHPWWSVLGPIGFAVCVWWFSKQIESEFDRDTS